MTIANLAAELKVVYADTISQTEKAMQQRKLNWRASVSVTPQTAVKILLPVLQGYNAFEPNLLLLLPKDAQIYLAREGSVCIYVKGKLSSRISQNPDLCADEVDYNTETDETRIWWD